MSWSPGLKRMLNQDVSLSSALAQLLEENALVAPSSNGSIVLVERSAGMRVEIPDPPESLVTINVSKLSHSSMLKYGECKKICDYLLVGEHEGNVYACLVELKRTLTGEREGREQLRRSLPLFDYLRSVCRVHFGITDWPDREIVRYNLVAERQNIRLDKQGVRRSPNDWPKVEQYENIEVRKFVGTRIAISKLL